MKQPIRRVLLATALILLVVGFPVLASAQAQSLPGFRDVRQSLQQSVSFKNPLVYVGQDGNVYMTDEQSGAGVPITGDSTGGPQDTPPFFSHSLAYGQFAWSADGKQLAFVERTQGLLYIVADGKPPVLAVKGVNGGFPPSFSQDGTEVSFVVKTNQQSGADNANLILQIQAVPAQGGNARALGSLEGKPWACGADLPFDPGEMVYFNEIGVIGPSPLTFAWTKLGFLHTMSCTGRGLAFSNGAKDLWENPALENAALSPDQTRALVIVLSDANDPNSAKKLAIVDLATGNLTPIDTQPNVDRAIWSTDGQSIIYTTLTPSRKVTSDKTKAVGTKLFQAHWPLPDVQEYGVFLWIMPVAGGQSTIILKDAGRGIGYLSAAHDKPEVAFSFVTSIAGMIRSINAGDPLNKVLGAAPHTEVRAVTPLDSTGLPITIATGGQPSFSPADSFSVIPAQLTVGVPTLVGNAPTLVPPIAVTATLVPPPPIPATPTNIPTATPSILLPSGGNCPGALPSRLHVGGQGRVLPGSSNRVRVTPATGAIIGNIPAGGVFDVLEGPVCTSNGIAWWRVNYNGLIGYTAEGQGSNYFVEPFTGTPVPPTTVPGTFGIVGVTAHVTPASSTTCPTTFNFAGQIVVNATGTVTYRWERSDGATGPVQTVNFGPGVTTVDVNTTWQLGAAGTFWERIHVLTPNDISSNQATFTLSCGAPPFTVTNVTASVSSPGGPACPIRYDFSATITVNGAGTVTYRWERSDGATSQSASITFGGPGSQVVTTSWTLGAHGQTVNGWERVHILSPNDLTSNQANFVLTCP